MNHHTDAKNTKSGQDEGVDNLDENQSKLNDYLNQTIQAEEAPGILGLLQSWDPGW